MDIYSCELEKQYYIRIKLWLCHFWGKSNKDRKNINQGASMPVYKNITMAHGAGGRVMQELIAKHILDRFTGTTLDELKIEVS